MDKHIATLEELRSFHKDFAFANIEEASRIIPALDAAIALMRGQSWQPIETAPKDREVIVYTSVGNPSTREGICMASFSYEDGGDSWWLCDSGDYVLNPSHWHEMLESPSNKDPADE